jgi:hypothetical protein
MARNLRTGAAASRRPGRASAHFQRREFDGHTTRKFAALVGTNGVCESVLRKKRLIVFENLSKDPSGETKAMLADLERRAADRNRDGAETTHWSRRFAASGKNGCAFAPPIPRSYKS